MTSQPPRISVCMPVYNAEAYVAQAVESILSQTLGDFEFLVIDDGSTDHSLQILSRYAEDDPRIRLEKRPNRGVTATLNELLDLARGEWIARMDADDVSLPERFERQAEYLLAHPDCVAVGSAAEVIDPDGDPICLWFLETDHDLLDAHNLLGTRGSSLCHPSVMMRRQAVFQVGKYSGLYRKCEDLDLWLRLAEIGRLANLPEPLIKYRTHGSNVNRSRTADEWLDPLRAVEAARRRRGMPEDPPLEPLSAPGRTAPADYHEVWGWQALQGGHIPTARKHARKLLARFPLSKNAWKLMYCALRGH